MNVEKNFFTQGVVKNWKRMPREMVESPPLEVFKRHVYVTPRTWFSGGLSSAGLSLELKFFSTERIL